MMSGKLTVLSCTLALAATLAATGFAASANAAGTRGDQPGRCKITELRASLHRAQSAAGHPGRRVVLTNVSGTPCTVYGYAGFGLLDENHRPQPTNVVRGGYVSGIDTGPHPVKLYPGQSSYAYLVWSDVPGRGEPTGGQCEPTSGYLEITPPNDYRHFTVRFGQPVCEHGTLYTTAFSKGTSPRG